MKKLFFLLLICFFNYSCINKEKIDLIIHNAKIISLDQYDNFHEAMAIKDGKIIAIGKENQILNKFSASKKIDVKSNFIYPGFIDAHCHFLSYGQSLNHVDLKGCISYEEMLERCQLQKIAVNEWLIGNGWDQNLWTSNSFPNKNKLDLKFPNTPVILFRVDGHAALANQKALQLAGINSNSKIKGGHVEIINNELTGILVDNAMNLILDSIPKESEQQNKRALLLAQKKCFELGLTTVDDAGLNKEDVFLIKKLHKSNELKIRIYAMLSDNEENFNYFLDSIGKPIKTEKLNIRSFKFYSDGALGSRGACLIKPYSDIKDSTYGMLLSDIEHFKKSAERLYKHGFQMCTHSIGDSAARTILNIYGNILKGVNDKRWRLEHAQVINENDFEMFGKYSIIPSIQPTHATSDMLWAILRLGKNRIRNGYAYKTLLEQNGMIALGTDFPIEGINPIHTFFAAVARKNLNGEPKNGFQKENSLTRIEALKGMTIWAAIANFEEKDKGSLEKGKYADFTILSNNLLEIPEDEILSTKVISTYLNGELVYGN
ncbi:MAG: amidohydrolase [Flavobacteriales bacterium]|nr:amidohydrolase [Flavobacteriales bacterium]